jgi:hypothetical protein
MKFSASDMAARNAIVSYLYPVSCNLCGLDIMIVLCKGLLISITLDVGVF